MTSKFQTESLSACIQIAHHKGGRAHVNYRDLEAITKKFKVFGYHCNPDLMPEDNKILLASDHPEILL